MEMFTTGQCMETESRLVVSLVWGLMVGVGVIMKSTGFPFELAKCSNDGSSVGCEHHQMVHFRWVNSTISPLHTNLQVATFQRCICIINLL